MILWYWDLAGPISAPKVHIPARILLSTAIFFEKVRPKILANTTTRGKSFGGVFLDVSRHPESESAIRMAKFLVDHELTHLLCLFVRDCKLPKEPFLLHSFSPDSTGPSITIGCLFCRLVLV
jgi:hypothetical protein